MSVASTSVTASSSPAHHSHYTEEYYGPDDMHNEHYIYVTYPPDLKRRLLEKSVLFSLAFSLFGYLKSNQVSPILKLTLFEFSVYASLLELEYVNLALFDMRLFISEI